MRWSKASLDAPDRVTARPGSGSRATLAALLVLCLAPASPLADEPAPRALEAEVVGVPWRGEPGITVMRGRNSCGTGSYGSASDGSVRDTAACP